MTEFDPRPPKRAITPVVAASAIVLLALLVAPAALVVGLGGVALLLTGANAGRRAYVSVGASVLFFAVVYAGRVGAEPGFALIGGIASVVAYDAAEHAVNLGVDMGRDARVGQSVLVHVATTASLLLVVAAIAFVVYTYGPESLPLTALLTLLIGGTLLAFWLRD